MNLEPFVEKKRLTDPSLERINFHVFLGRRLGIHHESQCGQLVGEICACRELVLDENRGASVAGSDGVAERQVLERTLARRLSAWIIGAGRCVLFRRIHEGREIAFGNCISNSNPG